MANSQIVVSGQRQRVQPLNGQQETRWCFLALVLILFCGGLGVANHQADEPEIKEHLSLSTQDRSLLINLSSAITEIRFLQQMDNQWPSIQLLAEQQIPPFDQIFPLSHASSELVGAASGGDYLWSTPEEGCYLGMSQQPELSSFLLLIPVTEGSGDEQPGKLYSQAEFYNQDELYKQAKSLDHADCHDLSQWQLQLTEF